ncbi:MAG: hypothetical protein AAF387_17140 [Pseudomonadota bacterium]
MKNANLSVVLGRASGLKNTYLDLPPLIFCLVTIVSTLIAVRTDFLLFLSLPILVWFVLIPTLDHYLNKDVPDDGSSQSRQAPPASLRRVDVELLWTSVLSIFAIAILAVSAVNSFAMLSLMGIEIGLLLFLGLSTVVQQAHTERCATAKFLGFVVKGLAFAPQLSQSAMQIRMSTAATAQDFSSARMGESYYRYLIRYFRGLFLAMSSPRRRDNESIILGGIFFLYCGVLIQLGGVEMLWLIGVQSLVAMWQLSSRDYVSHYGILRHKNDNGQSEELDARHRWQTTGPVNNALLRFAPIGTSSSEHEHQRATELRYEFGLNLLSLVVLIPKLWSRHANPRLANHVGHDLGKVNLDGNAYVELMEAYHREAEAR